MGWSADEIIQAHPHLALQQIHDALSYYENAREIQAEVREGEAKVAELRGVERPRSVDVCRR
jgi:hypothetical protein